MDFVISVLQQKKQMESQTNGNANGRHSETTGGPPAGCRWSVWHKLKSPWNRWNGQIRFNSICRCPVCFADPSRGRGEGGDNRRAGNKLVPGVVCLSPSSGGVSGEAKLPVKLALDHLTCRENCLGAHLCRCLCGLVVLKLLTPVSHQLESRLIFFENSIYHSSKII